MATPSKSDTVIVYTVIGGVHNAVTFSEVNVSVERHDPHEIGPLGTRRVWWGDTTYTIEGEGGVQAGGGTIEEVGAKIIAFQTEKAARLREERDEARRELNQLRATLRNIVDPPEDDDWNDDREEF